MADEMPAGHRSEEGDGVLAAISALNAGESQVAHAVRLARVVRSTEEEATERVELLRRVLAIDSRVARQTGLDVASDPEIEVRSAALGVLASTTGSEDDLARLLSLAADSRQPEHRALLQVAIDAIENPDPHESIALLLRLVDVQPAGRTVNLETLVPLQMHRSQLIRWVSKAWTRAADHKQPARFLDAALVVGGLVVDQVVLRASSRSGDVGVEPREIEQITYSLRDRPSAIQLAGRPALLGLFPWFAALAELDTMARVGAAVRRPRMSLLGASDIAGATAALQPLVDGWLTVMQD
ncbi:hypothetical protein [Nocardioides gansuensis]|uniref:hypothetical protein n=1 Tax=Nocardioides gansuensis TaxID=2138300 RepID=UPI0010576B1E|nr:hypothetical protein [Nocardioides gansuensis]